MTPEEADVIFAVRSSMHPHHTATPEEVNLWAMLLGDLPFDEAQAAVVAWYKSHRDPIMPVDIREAVLFEHGLIAPDHGEAWVEAVRECSLARRDSRPPVFSHQAIAEAVASVGGVWGVCLTENQTTLRAQFRDAFNASVKRHDRRTLSMPYDEAIALEAGSQPVIEIEGAPDAVVMPLRRQIGAAIKRVDDL